MSPRISEAMLLAHLNFVVQADGSVPDGTICPFCLQPRIGEYYYLYITLDRDTDYESTARKTTTKCRACRRKDGFERRERA